VLQEPISFQALPAPHIYSADRGWANTFTVSTSIPELSPCQTTNRRLPTLLKRRIEVGRVSKQEINLGLRPPEHPLSWHFGGAENSLLSESFTELTRLLAERSEQIPQAIAMMLLISGNVHRASLKQSEMI
jgi:hypothetical protein